MSISQNFPTITPTLNLNFARSKKLDPRITFTRTSSATRTNGQGLIEVVGANTPRFEHSVVGVGSTVTSVQSLGLLIEESRTNLFTYSEQFDNAAWFKTNVGITTNSAVSPDGTTTAEEVSPTTAGSQLRYVSQNYTISTAQSYTFSAFVKKTTLTSNLIGFRISNHTATADIYANFNFSTETFGSVSVTAGWTGSTTVQKFPNDWYRLSITANTVAATHTILSAQIWLGGYQGTTETIGNCLVWGAQFEVGAFPTSYIPTVASTVTRTGDLAFINLPSTGWYNYSQGSLVFQHSTVPYGTGTSPGYPAVGFAQTNGSSTNAIQYFFAKDTGGTQYLVRDAGVDQAGLGPTTPTGMSASKVGFAYTTNFFVLARNGSQLGTDTSGTVPQSIGTLLLGTNDKSVANNLNACISNVIYYPRALSSAQLQNLTK